MAEQTKAEIEKAIKSLDGFIQQIYWGENLTSKQSEKNIEEGLIQINLTVKPPRNGFATVTRSNGLLITKDGYFLTAKHCIDYDYHSGLVIDSKGRHYPIEKVCAQTAKCRDKNRRDDLALAKAKIEGSSEPMNYRIFNTELLKSGLAVALLYYDRQGALKRKYGFVKNLMNYMAVDLGDGTFESYPRQFVVQLDITAEQGHSGGMIICPEGRLVGIASNADVTGLDNFLGAAKFIKALGLVDFHKRSLIKKLINT